MKPADPLRNKSLVRERGREGGSEKERKTERGGECDGQNVLSSKELGLKKEE